MTDFRALCAELADELQGYKVSHPMHCRALLNRARAALAQPEPQGPTNERLTWLWNHLQVSRRQLMALRGENCLDDTDYQQFARSVLKQWGRPKPPSLKEQAQAELDRLIALIPSEGAIAMAEPIRCALEQLDD